jgi:hypothetical protein
MATLILACAVVSLLVSLLLLLQLLLLLLPIAVNGFRRHILHVVVKVGAIELCAKGFHAAVAGRPARSKGALRSHRPQLRGGRRHRVGDHERVVVD